MKKALAISVCTAAFISTYASMPMAQDSKMPAPNPTSTTTQSDSSMNIAKQTGSIDEHMEKMQALHDRMSAAATPEARQKIMAEQRQEIVAEESRASVSEPPSASRTLHATRG